MPQNDEANHDEISPPAAVSTLSSLNVQSLPEDDAEIDEKLSQEMEKAFILVNDIFKDIRVLLQEVRSSENVLRDQQTQLEKTLKEALCK